MIDVNMTALEMFRLKTGCTLTLADVGFESDILTKDETDVQNEFGIELPSEFLAHFYEAQIRSICYLVIIITDKNQDDILAKKIKEEKVL
ncbi:hypothetical protein [Latilactobacillus graminis]|nr:hypothetical protein [Latilactobacillus graminis]QFP78802.1 hypothetical protein LG542_00405 [Latilactobacillus graminis]